MVDERGSVLAQVFALPPRAYAGGAGSLVFASGSQAGIEAPMQLRHACRHESGSPEVAQILSVSTLPTPRTHPQEQECVKISCKAP